MAEPDLVAVEAASKAYRALKHQPSGEGFDDDGKGLWPADQFTFRLLEEGSIRRPKTDGNEPAAQSASSKGK